MPKASQKTWTTGRRDGAKQDVSVLCQIVAQLIVELDLIDAELAKLRGVKPARSRREWIKLLTS